MTDTTTGDQQTDDERRAANQATLEHVFTHLRELGDGPEEGVADYFAREILFESPYRNVRLIGVDQIHRALKEVADQFTTMRHTNMVFTPGVSPDEFVWESSADARFRASSEEYPQQYVVFCRMKLGKILTLRQYYNTRVFHLSNDAAPAFT
jgi:ketosteroid isomerase-like protein